MKPSASAIAANDAGVALADARDYAAALPHYLRARELAPDWYAPHLNLCIAAKHAGDWKLVASSSRRALALDPERAKGAAHWNLGIAATALEDWTAAREAWRACGIRLPEGEGPIAMRVGPTPIRVAVHAHPEVVWCDRIDPARAYIRSIPTPETERRYGDLLLHDGEPVGKRRLDSGSTQLVSVFNELAVLHPSAYATWTLTIACPDAAERDALFEKLADLDVGFEDWTESLHALCKDCSEGNAHPSHPEPPPAPWSPERRIALALREPSAFATVEEWAQSGAGRQLGARERLL